MSMERFLRLSIIPALGGAFTACAAPAPRAIPAVQAPRPAVLPASAPPAAPAPPSAPAPAKAPLNSYFNGQYRFTCAIPDGFVVTHESEGPGEIMTLVLQSPSSNATANFSVRAAALGRMTLEQYMDFRIARDLQGSAGAARWDKQPTVHGAYSGVELVLERQYANGAFKSKIFGFSRGPNVFVINYSASADQFDRDQKVVDRFLESLSFAP